MPMASQVGVGGEILDRMLALRPDLREAFLRGLRAAAGKPPSAAAAARRSIATTPRGSRRHRAGGVGRTSTCQPCECAR